MMRFTVVLALILAPLAAPVVARSPGDIAEVRTGLLSLAVADTIRRQCDDISPRMLRAFNFLNSIEAAAKSAGFSDAEIDEFVDDKVARAHLEAEARQYLASKGVDPDVPSTYCITGQKEIAQGTSVGRLLRTR